MARTVTIGGASGFWGDAAMATPQLLAHPGLDFIVYDFLAEITMAILARARARDENAGYATDFITTAMIPNLPQIAEKGVRIIANAGGVNPGGCARALRAEIARQGLALRVAVVTGDDLMPRLDALAAAGPVDMFSGAPFPPPDKVGSVNAYLGAFPIAQALDRGADIVITGRCVDSAVTLGALIHAHGWGAGDLDALAGGSLAGHLLECGPQATGGNFTDWREVVSGLGNIGYPVAEIDEDGSLVLTKPDGTGGKVSRGTVGEQMLYEIGDPQAYLLPDVTCDFSAVALEEVARDRVAVSGARGRPPTDTLKACLTWENGWRGGHLFSFYGLEAEAKARAFAEAAVARARAVLKRANAADFSEVSTEVIGAEEQFGVLRETPAAREVAVKVAVKHPEARGVAAFLREATGLGLATPPGLSGFAGTRPRPSPVMALFSFPVKKEGLGVWVEDEAGCVEVSFAAGAALEEPVRPAPPPRPDPGAMMVQLPIIDLAWGRSGDKGDKANIGLIARREAYMPWLWHRVDNALIENVFSHFLEGGVERFLLPGSASMNIVLDRVLGGGGTSSLRNDPQGKGYAQLLLAATISVPAGLVG